MIPHHPSSTLFPYTTLFRSVANSSTSAMVAGMPARNNVSDCRTSISSRKGLNPAGSVRLKRSQEHTSELQSRRDLVCRLLLEKKKITIYLFIKFKLTSPSYM